MKTVLTVVGARPQFIKAAPLSRLLRTRFREVLLHTGQHYDHGLSAVFFEELGLPAPDVNLKVGSLPHGRQVRKMAEGIEAEIRSLRPDLVLAFGDTNSTLAAALASLRSGAPLAHVEAGLRSFRPDMPEEVNRIVVDHVAEHCFSPTPVARRNLEEEGLGDRVREVGDVMLDAVLAARERAGEKRIANIGLHRGGYCFATVHRAENTAPASVLTDILAGLGDVPLPVVLALHPRTRLALTDAMSKPPANVRLLDPVSYLESIALTAGAHRVFTDSGGLQKECYFLSVPCVTLREETEWEETLAGGWNRLVGADPAAIRDAFDREPETAAPDLAPFGDGRASERILAILLRD